MVVTKTTKKKTRKACNRCGDVFNVANGFYSISQPDDNFPDDKVNVCKKCYQLAWEDETTGFNAFIDFLRITNLPYVEDLYNEVSKTDYIRRVRLSYSNLRFKDSDNLVENKSTIQVKQGKLKELTEEQMQECADFWGAGYEESDYLYLMSQYEKYVSSYMVDTPVMEDVVSKIIQTDLEIRKANEAGRDASKLVKTYQELLTTASLKPSQEKAAQEGENNTFGNWIKKIENEEPIPIPDKKFLDVDGIIKYIKVFFLGAMAKSLGEQNPYQKETDEVMKELTVDYDDGRDD